LNRSGLRQYAVKTEAGRDTRPGWEAKGLTLYYLPPYYRTLKWDEKAEIVLR